MDSVLRRIFLSALEVDLCWVESLGYFASAYGEIYSQQLPGGEAYDSWRRWWYMPRRRRELLEYMERHDPVNEVCR